MITFLKILQIKMITSFLNTYAAWQHLFLEIFHLTINIQYLIILWHTDWWGGLHI